MAQHFYRTPTNEDALSQGDIFFDLPVPQLVFEPLFHLESAGSNNYTTAKAEGGARPGMRMLADIEFHHGIVITQSCDAPRVDRIMVAPLLPYEKEGKSAKEQWAFISNLATSLHEPTRLYLPDDGSRRLPRHIVDLGGVFTFHREDMEAFVRQNKRVAALGVEGLRYLQFRLAVMFWRVARDDHEWPSDKDLALKVSVLEGDRSRLEKERQSKQGEHEKVEGKIAEATNDESRGKLQKARQRIEGELADLRLDLEEKERELRQARAAVAGRAGAAQAGAPAPQEALPPPPAGDGA